MASPAGLPRSQRLHFHPHLKEGTLTGSPGKGRLGQLMLMGTLLLPLPWVPPYLPDPTSQVNPSQGLLTLLLLTLVSEGVWAAPCSAFCSHIPPLHPQGPSRQTLLKSTPSYRHQIQRKTGNLKEATFSQGITTGLLLTIRRGKTQRGQFCHKLKNEGAHE